MLVGEEEMEMRSDAKEKEEEKKEGKEETEEDKNNSCGEEGRGKMNKKKTVARRLEGRNEIR